MRLKQPKLLLFRGTLKAPCDTGASLSSVQVARLRQIAGLLHLQLTIVPEEQFASPLGLLAKVEGWKFSILAMPPVADEALTEDILILAGLPDDTMDRLLSLMRAQGVSLSLKAVLTDTNVNWNALQLQHELTRERNRFM